MNKAVLPNHLIIHFSFKETFDDGCQEVTVDRSILPELYESEIFEVEAKVNSGEQLTPTEEQLLRMAFHLRPDELDNVELEIVTVMRTDHIGRLFY